MLPIFLLVGSNLFMTVAWYGHLRFKHAELWIVILISWLIALPEYMLQVPANRLGTNIYSATQMKIFTEVISLTLFILFGYFYLEESPSWRTGLAFALILTAAVLAASDHKHGEIPQRDARAGGTTET